MMTDIPVGVIGHICNKGESHPYVAIQDTGGGYRILVSTTPDFENEVAEGRGDWVLKEDLEGYFQETGWQVEWSAVMLPDG